MVSFSFFIGLGGATLLWYLFLAWLFGFKTSIGEECGQYLSFAIIYDLISHTDMPTLTWLWPWHPEFDNHNKRKPDPRYRLYIGVKNWYWWDCSGMKLWRRIWNTLEIQCQLIVKCDWFVANETMCRTRNQFLACSVPGRWDRRCAKLLWGKRRGSVTVPSQGKSQGQRESGPSHIRHQDQGAMAFHRLGSEHQLLSISYLLLLVLYSKNHLWKARPR